MMLVQGADGRFHSVESPEERRERRMTKTDPIIVDALKTKLSVLDKAILDKHAEIEALEAEHKVVKAKLQQAIQGE
jgi:hypothetical protein